ncbi:Heavy metal-associated isoprenylated plant protein 33, partial [Mucuna pruriens]
MGKYVESAARLEELSRIVSSTKPHRPKGTVPKSANRVATPRSANPITCVKVESVNVKKMETLKECRTPLAKVVADCAKRWFQDTLKEAKSGDPAMQVLVGQMYYSGYGVTRDPQKRQEVEIQFGKYAVNGQVTEQVIQIHVVEVKVGLHCDDCIKKILKAIKKIEDIETYNVDTQLNKVIVTGNVTTQQVIRVLQKIGKNATAWEDAQIQ